MNGTRTPSILALFLLLAGALPALAEGPVRPALDGALTTEVAGWLPVRLVCERCTGADAPRLAALWRDDDGVQERRTLRTLSWEEGRFEWVGTDGALVELQGRLPEDGSHGWEVALPLSGAGLPFRVQAQLDGYTGESLAFWPERDRAQPIAVDFVPVADFLDANPQWDADDTLECDLLVPKKSGEAVAFFAEGRPVAWLYGQDGDETWTFQFVRPGGTLLDRVSVAVRPSDEGDHLGFRLPLSGLLGGEGRLELGAHSGLSSDEGLPVAVRVGAAGVVNLADCPRIPAELFEPELEIDTEGF